MNPKPFGIAYLIFSDVKYPVFKRNTIDQELGQQRDPYAKGWIRSTGKWPH